FFQAEDGIRDFHVTGVQTCALPILKPINTSNDFYKGLQSPLLPYLSGGDYSKNITPVDRELITQASTPSQDIQKSVAGIQKPNKIGRASCRERRKKKNEKK